MQISEDLIAKIDSLKTPAIIAISGVGGSGKSTFSKKLAEAINAPIIEIDSFIRDRTLSEYSNWNLIDFKRLEDEVLAPFKSGTNSIEYHHFDWAKNIATKLIQITSNNYIIIEGVGLFRPELMKYFDYTIWIDCPLEDAIKRGKKRDREEYHNPQDELWNGIWKKNDLEYLEHFKPAETADLIINNV